MQGSLDLKSRLKRESVNSLALEFDVSVGTMSRYKNGVEIKSSKLRQKLGLHALVEVEPCQDCGKVHIRKSCPDKVKKQRKLRWKITPPPCPDCDGAITEHGNFVMWCGHCECFKNLNVPQDYVKRYKY